NLQVALGVHQQLFESQRVNLNSNTNSSSPPVQLQPQLISTPTTHKRGLDESTSGVINATTTLSQALRQQQITQSQYVQPISFQQLKRAVSMGLNNKENYADLMSANIWPDKVGNVGITVIKLSYIPDAFSIVVRFVDQQYHDEFVKSEIERNFQSAENKYIDTCQL
ncbi:unnamed protein product, partial [Didymodactylos carnosus]